jgi:hypothetical protein
MRPAAAPTAVVVGVGIIIALTGCAGPAVRGGAGGMEASVAAAGPWAQEFGESLADASEYEAAVLEDGRITAAELTDAQARDRACMRDAGYDLQDADDGTSNVSRLDGRDLPATDVVNAAKQQCAARFDRNITFLYNEVRRNPEKQDDAKITVACLRAAGLVGEDYTARKWRSEDNAGKYSFNEWASGAVQCRLDPLGLWRDG